MEGRLNASGALGRARKPEAPEPFWQRLPSIMSSPLRGAALYTMLALTALSLLALLPGPIGMIFALMTWLGIYKAAFDILRNTADGFMDAPEVAQGELIDGAVLRMLALMILMIALVVALAILVSPILALVAMVLCVFMQPGAVISLAMDGSLRRAANPMVSLGLAVRIGWPYLAAFGLLFVIQASAATARHWLGNVMPPVLGDVVLMLVSIWALFATFHLMGYLVYQYHEELGYSPAAHARVDFQRDAPDQRLLDEAEGHVREGRLDTALEVLRADVRSRAVGLPVHELYQRLLAKSGLAGERAEHARYFLGQLLAEKQDRRALALLRESLEADADFVPLTQEQATHLVERARQSGQSQLTVDALHAMLRAWPRAPEFSQWSLDAALLLAERFGRDDQARALLTVALERCEDPAQRPKLEAALRAVSPTS
ncbi:hypothetical protein [Pseudoxanthomonas composti]|uniref:Uncharacterized protein n=1 Tax=Pseudoxanthomonas composti TaxID=2137479 RepID=A0A4Q1JW92_9GAMM|nr:hypothetical protein [Pseudoxanthomonas composti]RXR05173.1 hypothetical protein EPA99_10445 [Pseudoxanthomonas composti]